MEGNSLHDASHDFKAKRTSKSACHSILAEAKPCHVEYRPQTLEKYDKTPLKPE